MPTITLAHVAHLMRTAGMRADVDRIGGNVYAILTDDEVTVTIDGGQTSATGPAVELLVCRDGAPLLRSYIARDGEVVPLVTAATSNETVRTLNLTGRDVATLSALLGDAWSYRLGDADDINDRALDPEDAFALRRFAAFATNFDLTID